MATLTDTTDSQNGWLGFTSLKDIVETGIGGLVSYTAAKNSGNVATSETPVTGAQGASIDAATTQNIGTTIGQTLKSPVVVGGVVLLGLLYVAHKILKK